MQRLVHLIFTYKDMKILTYGIYETVTYDMCVSPGKDDIVGLVVCKNGCHC